MPRWMGFDAWGLLDSSEGRAVSDMSSLNTAFQGIQCQLSPLEGIEAEEKRKEVTFWPKAIESGSLLHRDCISICDHRLPYCTSVRITPVLAMCRMLELMTKFITNPHGVESDFQTVGRLYW